MFNYSPEVVYRDFVTDGVPTSLKWDPRKSDIRAMLAERDAVLEAGLSNGGLIYDTRANMDADLAHGANSSAWVVADSTVANNGIYRKSGASGSGSWTRLADLPYSFIRATDAGAGTANAIVATTSIPLPANDAATLIALNIYRNNTGAATVAFNGGSPLTIKTTTGADVQADYLVSGAIVAGYVSGSTFRLLSDVGTAADRAAAEAAADAAVQAASGVVSTQKSSTYATASYHPTVAPDFVQTAGYAAAGDGGGALYKKVVAEPSHEGKFSITLDDGVTVVWYEIAGNDLALASFGALGTGSDTTAIQNAIDCLAAKGGGRVRGEKGTSYTVDASGNQLLGRDYCIMLKSDIEYEDISISFNRTATDTDIVVTPDAGNLDALVTKNLTLRNFRVNGDSQTAGAGDGFNYRLYKVQNLRIEDVKSVDATSWGMRIEQCDGVFFDGFDADHSADVNADGCHLVDCRNVTGSVGRIITYGDDAFIIEASNYDIYNYDIDGLTVEAPTAGISAGRGILILRDTSVGTTERAMSNLKVGAVARNCYGPALAVSTGAASLTGSSFSVVSDHCSGGLTINTDGGGYAGRVENCVFDIVAQNTTGTNVTGMAIATFSTTGVLDNNTLRARIYNPNDGQGAVSLVGSRWKGEISVDYNPNVDKTTFSFGCDLYVTESDLNLQSVDAGTNIYLRSVAIDNTFRLGRIEGGATADLVTAVGAVNNRFVGGSIAGTITNSGGATNKFFGTKGAVNYGTVTLNFATDADGTASFSHGLGGTPSLVTLQLLASGVAFHVNVINRTSSIVDVQAYNTSSAPVTTGSYSFSYMVAL